MIDHIEESYRRPPPMRMDIMVAVETLLRAGFADEAGMVLWHLKSDEEKAATLKAILGRPA